MINAVTKLFLSDFAENNLADHYPHPKERQYHIIASFICGRCDKRNRECQERKYDQGSSISGRLVAVLKLYEFINADGGIL